MTQPADRSAPLAATLRSRPGIVHLGAADAATIAVRVQVADVWDVLRFETPESEPVLALKLAALERLLPRVQYADEYVMKLNGFEVLDEQVTLAAAGARDGSIFLLTSRRRRPVR